MSGVFQDKMNRWRTLAEEQTLGESLVHILELECNLRSENFLANCRRPHGTTAVRRAVGPGSQGTSVAPTRRGTLLPFSLSRCPAPTPILALNVKASHVSPRGAVRVHPVPGLLFWVESVCLSNVEIHRHLAAKPSCISIIILRMKPEVGLIEKKKLVESIFNSRASASCPQLYGTITFTPPPLEGA